MSLLSICLCLSNKQKLTYSVPFSILPFFLKLGELSAIMEGSEEFPDKKQQEANQYNAKYHAQDDSQNIHRLRTFYNTIQNILNNNNAHHVISSF